MANVRTPSTRATADRDRREASRPSSRCSPASTETSLRPVELRLRHAARASIRLPPGRVRSHHRAGSGTLVERRRRTSPDLSGSRRTNRCHRRSWRARSPAEERPVIDLELDQPPLERDTGRLRGAPALRAGPVTRPDVEAQTSEGTDIIRPAPSQGRRRRGAYLLEGRKEVFIRPSRRVGECRAGTSICMNLPITVGPVRNRFCGPGRWCDW